MKRKILNIFYGIDDFLSTLLYGGFIAMVTLLTYYEVSGKLSGDVDKAEYSTWFFVFFCLSIAVLVFNVVRIFVESFDKEEEVEENIVNFKGVNDEIEKLKHNLKFINKEVEFVINEIASSSNNNIKKDAEEISQDIKELKTNLAKARQGFSGIASIFNK